jgi:uncharacterized protein (DUF779 family)
MINDAAYWIAISQLSGWKHERLNNLIIRFFHEQKILHSIETGWTSPELNNYLKTLDFIEIVKKGRSNLFKLKGTPEDTELKLF